MLLNNDDIQIDLSGANVLVTGGSMGIGFAAAQACVLAGANVAICARGAADVGLAVHALRELRTDAKAVGLTADISLESEVARLFDEVRGQMGPLDGLVHSAGIYGPIGRIVDVDADEWLNVIRTNLFGSFLTTKFACEAMLGRGGRIVLLAGGGAASPFPHYSGYACSKAAVVRMVETVAQEMLSEGIEINALAPGFVATRLHRQTLTAGPELSGDEFLEKTKKMLDGDAVPASVGGRAAAFLVSGAAKGITGKFVAAPYDGWASWPTRVGSLVDSDVFTLRRIVPKDRGMDWQ